MPQSMLGARAIRHIRKLQLDLFETGFAEANPQVSIVLEHTDLATGVTSDRAPQRVLVRWRHDKKLIRVYGGLTTAMATSPSELDGMFMAFAPFQASTGDRFTLFGLRGRIIHVWPPRNGRQRASFTVESDKRPV